MDPWAITPSERAKHLEQFKSLNPTGGILTGEQAKGFFLQSKLPPPVLGQIWGLADVTCDGKMDVNEFSVACKLITLKVKGFTIPPVLPQSLKTVFSGPGFSSPHSNTGILSPTSTGILKPTSSGILSPSTTTGILVPTVLTQIRPIVPPPSGIGVIRRSVTMTSPPTAQQNPPLVMSASFTQAPASNMVSGMPLFPSVVSSPIPFGGPVSPQGSVVRSRSMSVSSQESVSSPLMEWAVPNPSRLKYTQMFNQNDRLKSGYLSGVQARNILLGTGLPQQILATVWTLSDLDSDGRLSCEEFVLSMHLCDVARQMGRLPPKLPADLIPPSFRSGGSRKHSIKSPGSVTFSGYNTGSNAQNPEPEPLMVSPGANTFEDKRKMNYDKGQAELDRRRKVLEDMAAREREERNRKEREEFEKQEKQRLELERRKQEEIERQIAIQREADERRFEELRKNEEQKELARKEMERQRRAEMEENKKQDILARRQKEQEEVLRLKGIKHGLGLELSQLADTVRELSGKITGTRVGVSKVKSDIDDMRQKRDSLLNEMGTLKGHAREQSQRLMHLAQEKLRIERLGNEGEVKQMSLKQLREKLQNMKQELAKKQGDTDIASTELHELRSTLSTLISSCKTIYDEYQDKNSKVISMRKKHHSEFDYNSAWVAPVKQGFAHEPEICSPTPTYYNALYDFESRSPDELSFTAGAIIQKSEGVVPDPGWLAGTLDGKSGWFPESFVEVLPSQEAVGSSAPTAVVFTQASVESNYSEPEPEATGEYYVALYSYESSEPGDLPFEAGETIFVSQAEGEWWTGSIGPDRVGIFPGNYVEKQGFGSDGDPYQAQNNEKVLFPTILNNNYASNTSNALLSPTKSRLESFEEDEIKREMSGITISRSKSSSKSPTTVKSSKKYEVATVLANYQGSGEGQLSLLRGQLITVRKKSKSGWWEGELQGKGTRREIGWFPGSYAKILGPSSVSQQSSSRTTPVPHGEMEMPGTEAPVYEDYKEQVIALYPYTAQNTDELSFVKEDVITVIAKDEPDWWRGQLGGTTGLFPVNYVQALSSSENKLDVAEAEDDPSWDGDSGAPPGDEEDEEVDWDSENEKENEQDQADLDRSFDDKSEGGQWDTTKPFGLDYYAKTYSSATIPYANPVQTGVSNNKNGFSSSLETKRQETINELMQTEETYMKDMNIVESCFIAPLHRSGLLTNEELTTIFVNWLDLIDCSYKLLKAFIIRRKTCENGVVLMIGDILCQQMPGMMTYIRFCSAQLRAASLIQQKCESSPEFVEFTKKCQADPRTQNLPLSSFLIKPMQRITRYPLLIKKILEHTPDNHADSQNLEEALSKAEELCAQVNEGVREQENSDRLEWMQNHINCAGLDERLIFNSLTNSLGPRKFLHHGVLRKTKSGKELLGFLFSDFLLLAQPTRPLNQTQFSFDRNRNLKFKIYRKPLFLTELKLQEDDTLNEAEFIIGTLSKAQQMAVCAPGISEKRLWVRSIKDAKNKFQQVQQQFLQKQRSKKTSAVGRLLVTVMEANKLDNKSKSVRRRRIQGKLKIVVVEGISLANRDPRGKSDPYCEVSLGSEIRRTTVIKDTLNPKWHDSMQFSVKDLHEDILCLTVFDKDQFSPDQFLGRTEIAISTIHEQTRNRKTPWIKTFPLLEIETGEVTIKIHLQIFEKQ